MDSVDMGNFITQELARMHIPMVPRSLHTIESQPTGHGGQSDDQMTIPLVMTLGLTYEKTSRKENYPTEAWLAINTKTLLSTGNMEK